MKLKLILIIAGIALAGITVTIVVIQSKEGAKRREAERQNVESADRLQSTLSNYNQTFKLNTAPPLWPDATTNRRSPATNSSRSPTEKR
ncbi:MAG: hypothetical protein L0Z50_28050 [Verrucomicrobiales bacterium]|nr:hypothetical protein [Verrucomicrobiales bacterium]